MYCAAQKAGRKDIECFYYEELIDDWGDRYV
jgi:hypothetical protein